MKKKKNDTILDGFLIMDGFDDCIVGIVERFDHDPIVCYDKTKVLKSLMKDDMTADEAVEYFEYNQLGAWVGEKTPCFITFMEDLPEGEIVHD